MGKKLILILMAFFSLTIFGGSPASADCCVWKQVVNDVVYQNQRFLEYPLWSEDTYRSIQIQFLGGPVHIDRISLYDEYGNPHEVRELTGYYLNGNVRSILIPPQKIYSLRFKLHSLVNNPVHFNVWLMM